MRRTAALFTAVALVLSAPAMGEDKEKAKEHFFKGKALFEEGAYDKAIIEFKESYGLSPVPVVLYNIAVCYDDLSKYAEAVKHYKKYLSVGKDEPAEKLAKVKERVGELSKFLGMLKLVVDAEGAEVLVDDAKAGVTPLETILLETGEHELVVRKTGYFESKQRFTIVSGQTAEIVVKLSKIAGVAGAKEPESASKVTVAPTAARPGKEQDQGAPVKKGDGKKKKLAPAAFGAMAALAGAAGVAAIATGVMAIKEDDKIPGMSAADDEWKKTADRRDTLALATDLLIGVTGAAAVAAIALAFFTDFKKPERATTAGVTLAPAPGGAGLIVTW